MLRWRGELGEIWEELDAQSRRLSKREGKAGREEQQARAKESPGDLVGLMRMMQGLRAAPEGGSLDPVEMERRRAAWSRKKDAEDKTG